MKTKEIRIKMTADSHARFVRIAERMDTNPATLGCIWIMEKMLAVESVTANADMANMFRQFTPLMEQLASEGEGSETEQEEGVDYKSIL